MSTSLGQPSTKTLTTGSLTGTMSASGRGGGTYRRRRAKMTNEKKIADDEFMAAAIGDVEWLKQTLRENGGDIHFDKNGLTPLHLSAIHGRLECLKLCIEKFKQDVNMPSSTGWRPVHLVISNQTGKRAMQCLSYLLEKGANPSIENDDGITPVHQAASEGHVQCLKLLIEVGAKIDERDCRGNTPLDLAKLWAHRKCARILASEGWHQDKSGVAKEMQQLKKVKMQQVLQELEDDEESKLDQQFYGQAAYDQWLSTRGLQPKATGPPKSDAPKPKKGNVKIREPLMKPNSVASSGHGDVTAEKGALTMSVSIGKKHSAGSKASRRDTVATIMSEADFGLSDGQSSKEERKPEVQRTIHVNPNRWNPSPFIPGKEYVPVLKDEYPRDEYTMMPRTDGAKKFFDGKHVTDDEGDEEQKEELKKKKLRRPKLPREVVHKVLSGDPTLHERPMLFKTQHIYDVHKKHKYALDEKPASEAPLHLCNDINSQLVKMSIRFPTDKNQDYFIHRQRGSHGQKSSGDRSSKRSEALTDWNPEVYPLPALLTTLKQMSKPDHYPNIHGQTHGVSFGDLATR
ncbi:uncharacterized protein [Littorina saxatilis]|uniref:Ankyrin repeat domain-containing protein 53 n=1 Tax=Littorina saxatilis TaxID=31220 RepID=A0AAN9BRQ1_9CAEN